MIFASRADAGAQLAERLCGYADRADVLILGIPRGGVPVAFEVAKALRASLDVFLSRKLGVPGQEELAFGAIVFGGGVFLHEQILREARLSQERIDQIAEKTKELLNERALLFRRTLQPLQVAGKTIILVDDGVATGSSIYAAVNALRQMHPAKLVVAVPVAPARTCAWLRTTLDELICLYTPANFYAVGQFYGTFPQVKDEEVIELLQRSRALPRHE